MTHNGGYLGNTLLKRTDQQHQWSSEQLAEMVKCMNDPVYFAENYIKIVHVDRGLIPFKMYDYQKEIIEKIFNNRRVAVLTARQAGKCVINSTEVRIRNKITGEVITTTVGNLYESARKTKYKDDANQT